MLPGCQVVVVVVVVVVVDVSNMDGSVPHWQIMGNSLVQSVPSAWPTPGLTKMHALSAGIVIERPRVKADPSNLVGGSHTFECES